MSGSGNTSPRDQTPIVRVVTPNVGFGSQIRLAYRRPVVDVNWVLGYQAGQAVMSDEKKSILIMCPKLTCRKVLSVPDQARGKSVRCRACATVIKVPEPGSEKAAG